MELILFLCVVGAGALGVASRFLLDTLFGTAGNFPWTTFTINLTGSFIAGAIAALPQLGPQGKSILLVGFCGGFTTFSALSLQALHLLERGETARAVLYLFVSPALGLGAAAAGLYLFRNAHF